MGKALKVIRHISVFVFLMIPLVSEGTPRDAVAHGSQTQQDCEEVTNGDYVQNISGIVDGDEIELVISARFGGAVESLKWRGKEFINTWDHGRQISYAWGMDGYGECLNPTEPGSAADFQSLFSTSRLLTVCRPAENLLTTTTQPAYWLAPGQSGFCAGGVKTAINDNLISNHILEKTIEIGYGGIENVIAFTAEITLPEGYNSNQVEIPTGYLTHEFNNFWLFNPQSGEISHPPSQSITEPWSFVYITNLPPILANNDGAYAMGAYTSESIEYYGIFATDVSNPADRTNKWTIVIREEPALAGTYTYQSFAIVGSLAQVEAAMTKLYKMHPVDFNPPIGFLDVVNCVEIAGWAWDPKVPNQPIEIEVYSLGEGGKVTLLARELANRPRQDLAAVLGDNGDHGYRFETADIIQSSDPVTISISAVNSTDGLPNQSLIGSGKTIECSELAPAPEPSSTANVNTNVIDEPKAVSPTDSGFTCFGSAVPLLAVTVFVLSNRRRRVDIIYRY